MSADTRNRPQGAAPGAGRRTTKSTSQQGQRRAPQFVPAWHYTTEDVLRALAGADAPTLARALDPYYFERRDQEVRFACPLCDDGKRAYAVGRWTWRCDRCDAHGSWVALRDAVARDVEAIVRLCRFVHGEVAG